MLCKYFFCKYFLAKAKRFADFKYLYCVGAGSETECRKEENLFLPVESFDSNLN